jgi:hypothetical protein
VDETWPTHSLPSAGYGREKAYVERVLDAFEARHPDTRVVRLRPAFIFQRSAATEQRRIFAGPFLPNPLLQWEALAFESEVPEEQQRREFYGRKTTAIEDSQAAGLVTTAIDPDVLDFLLLSLAGYWAAVPQVARMITGATTEVAKEDARRRAGVVEAARRLASRD